MRKIAAIVLVLGCLVVYIQAVDAATSVSACGILNTAGETYTLTQDVSAAGTCFTMTGNNITLDLNGHTIYYAQSSSGIGV